MNQDKIRDAQQILRHAIKLLQQGWQAKGVEKAIHADKILTEGLNTDE